MLRKEIKVKVADFLPITADVWQTEEGDITNLDWYIYHDFIPKRLMRRIMTIGGFKKVIKKPTLFIPPAPRFSAHIHTNDDIALFINTAIGISTQIRKVDYDFFRRYIYKCEFRVAEGRDEVITILCNKYIAGMIRPVDRSLVI